MTIERMDDFFTARVEDYDAHMLQNVPGCAQGYREMAARLPAGAKTLLDLGCGTGLELGPIFERLPDIAVTGVDLTQAMLDRLAAKYPDKSLRLVCASYFEADLGAEQFDCAVSFQSLHHFTHADKLGLYRRLHRALKPGGRYVECDYMVTDQAEEDLYFAESRRIRAQQGIAEGVFYHYDTPCTVANQLGLLTQAGFTGARQVWRMENTTLVAAEK